MDLSHRLTALVAQTEAALDRLVPAPLPGEEAGPTRLRDAMRYSLRAGGKRLRPVLTLAAAELSGRPGAIESALPVAVAIECLHTYSLIHDDLPCMDDDDLRRGVPTCHRAYDEATALLAGDALLTEAFLLLSTAYAETPALAARLVRELAEASSGRRLIGGQMQDLLAERDASGPAAVTPSRLEYIHLHKTAALLEASLVCGGLAGGLPAPDIERLRSAGRALGLAFQIVDDILDATAPTGTLGKTAGKDARSGKATGLSVHGLDGARALAAARTAEAEAAFAALPGDTTFLRALAGTMLARDR